MRISQCIMLGGLIPSLAAASHIDLSGVLSSRLTPTQDTIRIPAPATITLGGALVIGPGKVLQLASTLTVQGSLRIQGAVGDSVRVEPTAGSWSGIVVEGAGRTEADSVVIDYATVRGANAIALQVHGQERVRIARARFHLNRNTQPNGAPEGAAIRSLGSRFRIEDCVFESNRDLTTQSRGAAIFWRQGAARILGCVFRDDSAGRGAAIYADSLDSLVVERSRFSGQELTSSGYTSGGSIYSERSRVFIRRSHFSRGSSYLSDDRIGAVAIHDSAGILFHMSRDTVTGYRGLSTTAPVRVLSDSVHVENSVFHDNRIDPVTSLVGGALDVRARAILLADVLAYRNSADAGAFASLHAKASCHVVHSTIANNSAGSDAAIAVPNGGIAPVIHGSIIWGNTPSMPQTEGSGALNVIEKVGDAPYPGFVDSASGDFRLGPGSPHIDAGYALAPGLPALDLDGNPRTRFLSPDPGAFEYQGPRPSALMGVFSRDTLLPRADYAVAGPCLRVLDGVTLRIAAGAKLTFDKNCFEVFGALRVEGTGTDSVVFTSVAPKGWKGVQLVARSWNTLVDSDSSDMRRLVVENSFERSVLQGPGVVASYHACGFAGGEGAGALAIEATARARVDSCTFRGLGSGIVSGGWLRSRGTRTLGPGTAFVVEADAVLDDWRLSRSQLHLGPGGGPLLRNAVLDSTPVVVSANGATFIDVLAFGSGADVPAIRTNYGSLKVFHSTIVDNAYYGISTVGGSLEVRNSILWGNYGGVGVPQMTVGTGTNVVVRNSLIQNGWTGAGNLDSDPRFVTPSQRDYSLATGSPAIDAGDSTGMVALLTGIDLGGNPRFRGSAMDLGAYEAQIGSIFDPWGVGTTQVGRYSSPRPPHRATEAYDLLGRRSSPHPGVHRSGPSAILVDRGNLTKN